MTTNSFSGFVEYNRKKYRLIPIEKVWVDRDTPVGEPASYFERKPYNGRREFIPILEVKNGEVTDCLHYHYNWEKHRWEYTVTQELVDFLEELGIVIPEKTFNIFFNFITKGQEVTIHEIY